MGLQRKYMTIRHKHPVCRYMQNNVECFRDMNIPRVHGCRWMCDSWWQEKGKEKKVTVQGFIPRHISRWGFPLCELLETNVQSAQNDRWNQLFWRGILGARIYTDGCPMSGLFTMGSLYWLVNTHSIAVRVQCKFILRNLLVSMRYRRWRGCEIWSNLITLLFDT